MEGFRSPGASILETTHDGNRATEPIQPENASRIHFLLLRMGEGWDEGRCR
jgi:hypothetical protein